MKVTKLLSLLLCVKVIQAASLVSPAPAAVPIGHNMLAQTPTETTEALLERNSDLYMSQIPDQLVARWNKFKRSFARLDAQTIYAKIIDQNNLAAFDVVLGLALDPFAGDKHTHLSALDNLQSIQMRSEEQDRMLKMLEAKFKKSKLISKRQDANIEAIRAKYLVRTDQSIQIDANTPWDLPDGSKLIHQAIIGDNRRVFDQIVNNQSYKKKLNDRWGAPVSAEFRDQAPMGDERVDLEGWTPVMLAMALGRENIVDKMVQSGKFRLDDGHKGLTPYMLMMKLADDKRVAMLKKFGKKNENVYGRYRNLKAAFDARVRYTPAMLRHFIKTIDTNRVTSANEIFKKLVNIDTILSAMLTQAPADLDEFLDDISPLSDALISANNMLIWNKLKAMPAGANAETIKNGYAVLTRNGFRIDMKMVDGDRTTCPFIDFIENSNGVNVNLVDAILKSLKNVNTAGLGGNGQVNLELIPTSASSASTGESAESVADVDADNDLVSAIEINSNESLLISAIKHQNITLINRILADHEELKLEWDIKKIQRLPEEASYEEGYIHYVLRYIQKHTDIEPILNKLIEINNRCVNQKSCIFQKNVHEYSFRCEGEELGPIKYEITERLKWTPLMYAVFYRKDEDAKTLIRNGARFNDQGRDGICVKGICARRALAFKHFYDNYLNANRPAVENNETENRNRSTAAKMETIRAEAKILVNLFKRDLNAKLSI